jgi:hypothetical protein
VKTKSFPTVAGSGRVRGMLARVYSAAVLGVDAFEIEIEVNAANGLPATVMMCGFIPNAVRA